MSAIPGEGLFRFYTRLDLYTQPGLPLFEPGGQRDEVSQRLGNKLKTVLKNKTSRNTFVRILRSGINVDYSMGADSILKSEFDKFINANGIDDVSQMSEIDVLFPVKVLQQN